MSIDRRSAARPRSVGTHVLRPLLLLALCLSWERPASAQQLDPASRDSAFAYSAALSPTTRSSGVTASQSDTTPAKDDEDWPEGFVINWNEYNLGFTTFLWGAAVLPEYATYNQDSLSAVDFHLVRQGKIRDSRFLFFGKARTKRPITWQTGIMYDWAASVWRVRLTLINVVVPEIASVFQVGRLKEGLSLNRVLSGYDGWTLERFTFSDAAIPLLADGIKWMGYVPKAHFLWNLGAYANWLSEGESYSYYKQQLVGRAVYLRMDSDTAGKLLHAGVGFHVGKPEHDTLQLKSKPEVFEAPNFIDTGPFPATRGTIAGVEVYYRPGNWTFGTEYYGEWVKSPQYNNPFFHGGDIFASWIITGETRPYTAPLGTFRFVSPKRPVWQGGRGAWETVLRLSYSDLDSDTLSGGKFWRITPTVNWYLNDQARLELAYGFGGLTRFGGYSTTEFFQARMQLQFSKLAVQATD